MPKVKLTKLEKQARRESQSIRMASAYGGNGAFGGSGADIATGNSSFYSPQLSTDFLELPQSEREKRELFRFWYTRHPIVGAAIDFHTDVPMSKVRLSLPKGKDEKRNKEILAFFQRMSDRVNLFQSLYDITHEYWLHGNVFIFCEDHDLSDDIPEEFLYDYEEEQVGELEYDGNEIKKTVMNKVPKSKEQKEELIRKYVQKKYDGYQRIQILPPEQIKIETYQYTNRIKMELIPSEKDKSAIIEAQDGNAQSARIADDIPNEIRKSLIEGGSIPLNTSPYDDFLCSSFCYHLSHKRSPYDERGISILERCLTTLLYQDKLRQAQTSIASRAMTPKRVIWADKASVMDVEDLRAQIDQALIDPDYSIITNYEVHWDEIGSRDRLLDLASEYESTNKLLYIGLRITESMLTGESTYTGERIHLDVMNTMYLLYREQVAGSFVEENLFKPVAEKKGFWEEDEFGNKILLYPKLQFTRLALRDNSELSDYMFNLYQKGSLPVEYIYELLNIDPGDAHELLKRDLFTVKDSTFNEFLRNVMQASAADIAQNSNISEVISENSGLQYTSTDKKEESRF